MNTHIAFSGHQCVASGTLQQVALTLHGSQQAEQSPPLLFELATGRQIDIDIRGSQAEVEARFAPTASAEASSADAEAPAKPRRGRPKLGVVGREVTLLPRHWEWLDRQRGGASASLRRLIDDARKLSTEADDMRTAQDRTNRFMSAIAGDLPGFEEATRALYAGNEHDFVAHVETWPTDVKTYTLVFADGAFTGQQGSGRS